MNLIALIPARAGSKRIPGKNIKPFFGHPLVAYAIAGARTSEIFTGIFVSSDAEETGKIADHYGAYWIKRPEEFSIDLSPDVDWINHALSQVGFCDCFMILRPTNPFRTKETIRRSWALWDKGHCLKSVETIKQHPGKAWQLNDSKTTMCHPGLPYEHLLPIQNLPKLYIQNGCLEIRPTSYLDGLRCFYQPFFTQDYEGLDLNTPEDWILAEALVEKGLATLPKIEKELYV